MNQLTLNPSTKARLYPALIMLCMAFLLSCDSKTPDQKIPPVFQPYISKISTPVPYQSLTHPFSSPLADRSDSISSEDALQDIDMLEYLIKTSYSGYEYWRVKGVDFEAHIAELRDYAGQNQQISTLEFEIKMASILRQIYDGHLSFIGQGYHAAYHHKSVYYADILVELTGEGEYQVISSKSENVHEGALFTEEHPEPYLFRTLSTPEKEQFLLGNFTFHHNSSIALSFDNNILTIPLHKSRLMFSQFEDPEPYFITRQDDIPIVRVTSFGDALYPQMQNFMQAGFELRDEEIILMNLFYNGGGSSVFPQTFLSNLNGPIQWETYWAELTSPAISEYYANLELDPASSPALKDLKSRYARQLKYLQKSPEKSWGFSSTSKSDIPGSYDGTLVLLTNRRVLSAGENLVGASGSVKNRVVIGENTGGVAQFSSTVPYVLPHSRLVLNLPRQLIFIPGLEECVGYLPDYWLDTHEPMEEVLRWLEAPEKYQFNYRQTYQELLEDIDVLTVLPDDTHISKPGPAVPDSLAQFSGKWFGVGDGILDHLLAVENISTAGEVDAIYAWGVAYQWGVTPGWARYQGKFQGNKLILTAPDSILTISYEIRPDGSMDSWYKRPGILSYTELVKLEDK